MEVDALYCINLGSRAAGPGVALHAWTLSAKDDP